MRTIFTIGAALVLAGCSWTPSYTGSLCPIGPAVPDPGFQERWTRAEKEYALALNESGEKICGWTAPKGR